MGYSRTKPTDWNKYQNNRPTNAFVRWFFLDVMVRAYKKLLDHASFPEQPAILELGSGTGYVTKELSLFLHSKNVTLVDSNEGMLRISKHTFRDVPVHAKFIRSDFFALNRKEKYTLVHSGGVIEHFDHKSQQQLVNIHSDLLMPGGYCIIFVPTPTISYRIIRKIAELLHVWKYTDEIPMTESELVDVVQKSGLTVLASSYFWKWYWLSEVGVIAQKQQSHA